MPVGYGQCDAIESQTAAAQAFVIDDTSAGSAAGLVVVHGRVLKSRRRKACLPLWQHSVPVFCGKPRPVHTESMKQHLLLMALVTTLASGCAAAQPDKSPLQPIASLDVARYMGTWYEIAKYPNSFQNKCARNTRADYQPKPDGTVQVRNRCVMADGQTTEALGAARQVGPADSPKLQVRFAPAWLSFLPWVWGDYWVIDLDPQYQLVAVSEPKREYLWVLSRTPTVEPAAYQALLARLAPRGFDMTRLELSPQE